MAIPITCPTCGTQQLEYFPKAVATAVITRWDRMWVHSTCHYQQWNASASEIRQIQEFLGLAPAEKGPASFPRWDLMQPKKTKRV